MLTITSVTGEDPIGLTSTRRLWQAYRDFLSAGSHTACDIERLDREIRSVPEPYASHGGEVLLALLDSSGTPGAQEPAGTIAFYTFPDAPAAEPTCEIKRLFVPAKLRGRGLGEALVEEALRRAHRRGYVRACLDTMPAEMAAALRLYRRLGFRAMSNPPDTGRTVLYLDRPLP